MGFTKYKQLFKQIFFLYGTSIVSVLGSLGVLLAKFILYGIILTFGKANPHVL